MWWWWWGYEKGMNIPKKKDCFHFNELIKNYFYLSRSIFCTFYEHKIIVDIQNDVEGSWWDMTVRLCIIKFYYLSSFEIHKMFKWW